jgi:pyrroline-5-carboxylate reductase
MLVTSSDSPAELRRKVTSPKGTTEAAIASFENDNVRDVIARAVKAATSRGDELGKILGAQVQFVV